MTDVEAAKDEFFEQAKTFLCNHPSELKAFMDVWAAGKLRQAYLVVDNAVRNYGLSRSERAQKTDEDFYWLFVN